MLKQFEYYIKNSRQDKNFFTIYAIMYLKLAKSEVGICGLFGKCIGVVVNNMYKHRKCLKPAKKRIILEKGLEIATELYETNLPVSNKGEF